MCKTRSISYITLSLILIILSISLDHSTWLSTNFVHTIMEVIASLLAFVVGLISIIRYYAKKNYKFLFIGTGFIGTAIFDLYHTFASSQAFISLFPSSPPSLIAWSWLSSRIFLAIFLLLSCSVIKFEGKFKKQFFSEKHIYGFVIILFIINSVLFIFYPFPKAYYPHLFFHRPQELIPAVFFLIALIMYLKEGLWKNNYFEYFLVLGFGNLQDSCHSF